MSLKVDIAQLYALAERLENLGKDMYVLSNNSVNAANSVLERTDKSENEQLRIACKEAQKSIQLIKELTCKVNDTLVCQTGELRRAAYYYRENDRIDRIN